VAVEVADSIECAGGVARAYEADFADAASAPSLVARVAADFGGLTVLVNAVGVIRDGLVMELSDDHIDVVLNVNLKSVLAVSRAAARYMMSAHHGSIVNVSSIAATRPRAGQAHYAAAKAGVEGLTRALAIELASKNIRVNAVAPGLIDSRMTEDVRTRRTDQLLRSIPLGRFGCPDDVAAAVRFLASREAAYITGHVLHVDGGRHCG
jgi:3-oxoacyl-[acyl-carrier protein] reductase